MVENKGNIQKVLNFFEDLDFSSSRCKACMTKIPWALRFCIFCGVENEHFDPDYDDCAGEDCFQSHAEISIELEEESTQGFCGSCGIVLG